MKEISLLPVLALFASPVQAQHRTSPDPRALARHLSVISSGNTTSSALLDLVDVPLSSSGSSVAYTFHDAANPKSSSCASGTRLSGSGFVVGACYAVSGDYSSSMSYTKCSSSGGNVALTFLNCASSDCTKCEEVSWSMPACDGVGGSVTCASAMGWEDFPEFDYHIEMYYDDKGCTAGSLDVWSAFASNGCDSSWNQKCYSGDGKTYTAGFCT